LRKVDVAARQEQLGLAVADDVLQLARSRRRIDRDDGRPRRERAEDADARLEARLGPDRDALNALEPGGDTAGPVAELAVGQAPGADPHRLAVVRLGQTREERLRHGDTLPPYPCRRLVRSIDNESGGDRCCSS